MVPMPFKEKAALAHCSRSIKALNRCSILPQDLKSVGNAKAALGERHIALDRP